MSTERSSHLGRLVLLIAVFAILGTPLVAYLWETTNVLLSGVVRPLQLGVAVVLIPLFIVLLRLLAKRIQVVEGTRDEQPGALREPPRARP
jgi:hypothetical protein